MAKPKKKISLEDVRNVLGGLSMAQAFYPRDRYIGGTPEQARARYWKQDPEMYIITDSIANEYDINPNLLRARLDAEGFTDDRINDINHLVKRNNKEVIYDWTGSNFANRQSVPKDAIMLYGLDDMGTYINNGDAKLINENWGTGDFTNEKGRHTVAASGYTHKDNIGILASGLRMFRDKAKEDFPNASESDLDRYASAYYNRGAAGGKQWVKNGAKGYNVKRSLKAAGGSIHIAPSKRGTFTAAATKHGMGVQAFASKVLANKENYSPAMVKKANFARNASKWH